MACVLFRKHSKLTREIYLNFLKSVDKFFVRATLLEFIKNHNIEGTRKQERDVKRFFNHMYNHPHYPINPKYTPHYIETFNRESLNYLCSLYCGGVRNCHGNFNYIVLDCLSFL